MKILIIEDEKLLADSLKALLESKGFTVETVYDGESGEAYAETGVYDLLIPDAENGWLCGSAAGAGTSVQHADFNVDRKIRVGRPHRRIERGRRLLFDKAL